MEPIVAEVAELADAQDLKSCETYTLVPVRFRFSAPNVAEWSSWQLVGLITRRSEVQVLPPQPFFCYGSLVKRLRHRPFTAVTGVQFPYESPIMWDHSSAGRAPALQAGGHRFEPCWSHHLNNNAAWLFSWLECQPVSLEVEGSSPFQVAKISGNSSVVERNLAKVEVASSNLVSRSIYMGA